MTWPLSRAALGVSVAALLVAGCPRESGEPDASFRLDGGGMDAGRDAAARTCTAAAECDDGLACTNDGCGVGSVCRNTPLDELCADAPECSQAHRVLSTTRVSQELLKQVGKDPCNSHSRYQV